MVTILAPAMLEVLEVKEVVVATEKCVELSEAELTREYHGRCGCSY